MNIEKCHPDIPDNLVFYRHNWKIVGIFDGGAPLALIMPKEPGIETSFTGGVQILLAAMIDEDNISRNIFVGLCYQKKGGFILTGSGFDHIHINSDISAKYHPGFVRKIRTLVGKVNHHEGVLIKNSNQGELEKAALDIAPVLAKFFEVEE